MTRTRLYPAASTRVDARVVGSVVGLDLSLRATSACALPLGWDHDLSTVRFRRVGHALGVDASARERIERWCTICDGLLDFCREVQARHVYIENHAFGAGGARAYETIEMTGTVKKALFEDWGVVLEPIAAVTARKTLLQQLPSLRGRPRGFMKAHVVRNVKRLGGPTEAWTDDDVDAFVVANHGLMVRGHVALTFLGV